MEVAELVVVRRVSHLMEVAELVVSLFAARLNVSISFSTAMAFSRLLAPSSCSTDPYSSQITGF